jgi:imidazoleglycerol-phosphate dehydratase
MNLHIKLLSGHNDHHITEAIFKSFAKALSEAITIDPRVEGVLSTKGVI